MNKVAFLCHFDSPLSAKSLPDILEELAKHVPQEHHFEAVLIGGKRWFWSPITRKRIKEFASKQSVINLNFSDIPFCNRPINTIDVTISPITGETHHHKLSGRPARKGFLWFFKKIIKVEVTLTNKD